MAPSARCERAEHARTAHSVNTKTHVLHMFCHNIASVSAGSCQMFRSVILYLKTTFVLHKRNSMSTLSVKGMRCAHCQKSVAEAMEKVPGAGR